MPVETEEIIRNSEATLNRNKAQGARLKEDVLHGSDLPCALGRAPCAYFFCATNSATPFSSTVSW